MHSAQIDFWLLMFEHPLFPHAMLPQIIWAMGLEEHRGTWKKNPCAVSNLFWMSRPLHSSQMKWLFVCHHDGLGSPCILALVTWGDCMWNKVSSGDSCTRTHTHTHTCSEVSYRIVDVESIGRAKTTQLNLTGMIYIYIYCDIPAAHDGAQGLPQQCPATAPTEGVCRPGPLLAGTFTRVPGGCLHWPPTPPGPRWPPAD